MCPDGGKRAAMAMAGFTASVAGTTLDKIEVMRKRPCPRFLGTDTRTESNCARLLMQECGEAIKYLERRRRQKPENIRCAYELAIAYTADRCAEAAKLPDDPTCAELVKHDERFGSLPDAGKLQ